MDLEEVDDVAVDGAVDDVAKRPAEDERQRPAEHLLVTVAAQHPDDEDGGAVGNVIDRAIHGYVVDFIQVHAGGWYFPAFNVADSAITIGAVCLILDELLRVRRGK